MLLLLACTPEVAEPDDTAQVVDTADTADTADSGDSGAPAFFSDDAIKDIERAVTKDLRKNDASGAQVAVWHDGELVYAMSFGTKHPDTEDVVDDATLFQIGSDTKKITALAALQQVEAGTLSLDSTVANVLPEVSLTLNPEWAGSATLHDLLSHQGGLFDFTPWDDNPDDGYLRSLAEGEFSDRGWQLAPPGEFWNYANPNFSIAGLMTEAATGRAWPDIVEDDVFAPMGLVDTYARKSEVEARGNYATGTGYIIAGDDAFDLLDSPEYSFGTVEMAAVSDNAFTRPAGMVWSTASDMARLGGFFIVGDTTVLSDDLRGEMTTMQVPLYPVWDAQAYGYGWMIVQGASLGADYYDVPVWVHGGNTLSFTSTTYVLPEQKLSFSILSNSYGDDFTQTVVELIAGSGLLPEPSDDPGLPADETDHGELVGTYDEPTLGPIVITDDKGKLNMEVPFFDELGIGYDTELDYAGLTDLYYATVNGSTLDLTFVADDSGVYTWMRNRSYVGTRQ